MSQLGQTQPSVVMNVHGNRHEVPLRDYLNVRVAPFVKKAITQSLAADAEFPLQWLGEYLIHQSMLYEGNPDSTGIREKFRYNFEIPATTEPKTNGESLPAETGPEPEVDLEHKIIDTQVADETPQLNGAMDIKEESKEEAVPEVLPAPAPVQSVVLEVQDTEMVDPS